MDDAEVAALLARHGNAADGQVGVALEVRAEHDAVVHLVDVVAGQDEDVAGVGLLDGVDVLVDGVGGALVPVLVDALLRRQHLDVLVEGAAEEAPASGNVAIEAAGLVLRQDVDAAQVAVDAVGEGKVDDAIESAEGHGGLGPVARQRVEPGALAACQDQRQYLAHGACLPWGDPLALACCLFCRVGRGEERPKP